MSRLLGGQPDGSSRRKGEGGAASRTRAIPHRKTRQNLKQLTNGVARGRYLTLMSKLEDLHFQQRGALPNLNPIPLAAGYKPGSRLHLILSLIPTCTGDGSQRIRFLLWSSPRSKTNLTLVLRAIRRMSKRGKHWKEIRGVSGKGSRAA